MKGVLKALGLILVYFLLVIASILSFLSMGLIVALYFTPTISYTLPFMVPTYIALFLFLSQSIPGYFAKDKKYMLFTLLLSASLVGMLFGLLSIIKGLIYAGACILGNYCGFYLRKKMNV